MVRAAKSSLVLITVILINSFHPGFTLKILSSCKNTTDGYFRFLRSAKQFGSDIVNQAQSGDNALDDLKDMLRTLDKSETALIINNCDDTIIAAASDELMTVFEKFKAPVVVTDGMTAKYANKIAILLKSPAIMGNVKALNEILSLASCESENDESCLATPSDSKSPEIKRDSESELFLLESGETDSKFQLKFTKTKVQLESKAKGSLFRPLVISAERGNLQGRSKVNYYGNYISNAWTKDEQCISCKEVALNLEDDFDWPLITVGLFIREETPFVDEFFQTFESLEYPKDKLDLVLLNEVDFHIGHVKSFLERSENKYRSVQHFGPNDKRSELTVKELAMKRCIDRKCAFYLNLEADAHLDEPSTLKELIRQNRKVVSPFLKRHAPIGPSKHDGNFFTHIDEKGVFSKKSPDFQKIADNSRTGAWNVPCVTSAYLIKREVMEDRSTLPEYYNESFDIDEAFCLSLLEKGVFMHLNNQKTFGHVLNMEDNDINPNRLHNELWQMTKNRLDWEMRYLHPNYTSSRNESQALEEPCTDVFWVPLVSETFADHLVEEMEHFGEWSGGGHKDKRLSSGYEAYPTRDIHFRQIQLHNDWLEFLRIYVAPIVARAFLGYTAATPRAELAFVIRYKPEEQAFLTPHFDASLYSVNIALNHAGKDFTGGGCRFIRKDCSVTDTRKGWALIHPGKLTHYHEGLPVTSGTRYIFVSFVDP